MQLMTAFGALLIPVIDAVLFASKVTRPVVLSTARPAPISTPLTDTRTLPATGL